MTASQIGALSESEQLELSAICVDVVRAKGRRTVALETMSQHDVMIHTLEWDDATAKLALWLERHGAKGLQ